MDFRKVSRLYRACRGRDVILLEILWRFLVTRSGRRIAFELLRLSDADASGRDEFRGRATSLNGGAAGNRNDRP